MAAIIWLVAIVVLIVAVRSSDSRMLDETIQPLF